MDKVSNATTTSISFSEWTSLTTLPSVVIKPNTVFEMSDNVVLIKGQYVVGADGVKQLMVTVDPATIERKLAIRELNAQLEGRILKSHTQTVAL
jgi:hypothetical protein